MSDFNGELETGDLELMKPYKISTGEFRVAHWQVYPSENFGRPVGSIISGEDTIFLLQPPIPDKVVKSHPSISPRQFYVKGWKCMVGTSNGLLGWFYAPRSTRFTSVSDDDTDD